MARDRSASPLDASLTDAANRTTDRAVREWLLRLRDRGESAQGGSGDKQEAAEQRAVEVRSVNRE
jgi:hypothetical protein